MRLCALCRFFCLKKLKYQMENPLHSQIEALIVFAGVNAFA